MYKIFISKAAKKAAKRLPSVVREKVIVLCREIIAKNPRSVHKLHKPLDACYSYHFKMNNVHYRIAYIILEKEERIDVVLIGVRENFYKRLKQIIR